MVYKNGVLKKSTRTGIRNFVKEYSDDTITTKDNTGNITNKIVKGIGRDRDIYENGKLIKHIDADKNLSANVSEYIDNPNSEIREIETGFIEASNKPEYKITYGREGKSTFKTKTEVFEADGKTLKAIETENFNGGRTVESFKDGKFNEKK